MYPTIFVVKLSYYSIYILLTITLFYDELLKYNFFSFTIMGYSIENLCLKNYLSELVVKYIYGDQLSVSSDILICFGYIYCPVHMITKFHRG